MRHRTGSPVEPLLTIAGGMAYVEAVKLAEDHSGDVVVRMYEPLGARTDVTLRLAVRNCGSWAGSGPQTA